MKKLDGYQVDVLKEIIREGETVFEIDGKKYSLSLLEEPVTTVIEDVDKDPTLKLKLLQAKRDIKEGNVYATDKILKMIDQGEL